jgi:O-antigen ligase
MVYLICMITPFWFNLGPLQLSLLRLFLIIMIVPLLVRLLTGQFGRMIVCDFLFILHVFWIGVSLAVNTPSQAVTQVGSVGVEFLGGYLVARAYIRSAGTFIALCRTLLIIGLCLLPLAMIEAVTGRVPVVEAINALPFGSSVGLAGDEQRMGLHRVQAVFVHPIHFGLFCSVIFPLVFVALKDVIPTGRRLVYSALIALTCFLSLSSGAILALALQFGMILWAAMFNRIGFRWWLLVGLFAVAFVVVDLLSNRTPMQVFMSRATFSSHNAYIRAIIFDFGIANVWANPIFGLGLKDWVRPEWLPPSVDNFWLVIAMRYGIPGFLFLVVGYVAVIFGVMRRDFSGDPVLANIRRAWVFTFLGLSFTLATVHVWTSIYSFTFFMFGAGIWLMTASSTVSATVEDGVPASDGDKGQRGSRYSRYPPMIKRRAVRDKH